MTIERTTKLATIVDDLPAAWAFIMQHIDVLGSAPSIHISPMWSYSDDENGRRQFEIAVSGMIPDPEIEA